MPKRAVGAGNPFRSKTGRTREPLPSPTHRGQTAHPIPFSWTKRPATQTIQTEKRTSYETKSTPKGFCSSAAPFRSRSRRPCGPPSKLVCRARHAHPDPFSRPRSSTTRTKQAKEMKAPTRNSAPQEGFVQAQTRFATDQGALAIRHRGGHTEHELPPRTNFRGPLSGEPNTRHGETADFGAAIVWPLLSGRPKK